MLYYSKFPYSLSEIQDPNGFEYQHIRFISDATIESLINHTQEIKRLDY